VPDLNVHRCDTIEDRKQTRASLESAFRVTTALSGVLGAHKIKTLEPLFGGPRFYSFANAKS